MIGEAGLTTALHEAGFIMTETDPDYVVVGETRNYSFEAITKAIRFIAAGARFIATNPDATGPSADGVLPATGAIAALITKAIGKEPYVVGKPNPMMFRSALNRIGAHSENTGMIGDRMDTDIVAGIEAGLHTVLVLTGISDAAEIERYPFRPDEVLDSVADLSRRAGRDRRPRPKCVDSLWMGALDDGERVLAPDAATWRAWLEENHAPPRARGSCAPGPVRTGVVGYEDAIMQALCFGWIDGPVRTFDEQTGGLWFAPRRPSSGWAATNKARLILLEERRAHGRGRHPRGRGGEGERRRGPCSTTPRRCANRTISRPRWMRCPSRATAWDAFPPSARKFGIAAVDCRAPARDARRAHREDRGGCRGTAGGRAPAMTEFEQTLLFAATGIVLRRHARSCSSGSTCAAAARTERVVRALARPDVAPSARLVAARGLPKRHVRERRLTLGRRIPPDRGITVRRRAGAPDGQPARATAAEDPGRRGRSRRATAGPRPRRRPARRSCGRRSPRRRWARRPRAAGPRQP